MKRIGIIIAIVVIAFIWGGATYNSLIKQSQAVDGQWAQVETQYQRRVDLVPNLVETVKGITQQEQEVFGQLADARSRYANAGTPDEQASAATAIESGLSRLLVIVENYPQLRSSESFQTLMAQLEGTENRISVERKRFNDTVRDYNTRIKRFPTNILASLFGFDERNYFAAESGAENAPEVQF